MLKVTSMQILQSGENLQNTGSEKLVSLDSLKALQRLNTSLTINASVVGLTQVCLCGGCRSQTEGNGKVS